MSQRRCQLVDHATYTNGIRGIVAGHGRLTSSRQRLNLIDQDANERFVVIQQVSDALEQLHDQLAALAEPLCVGRLAIRTTSYDDDIAAVPLVVPC